MKLDRWRDLLDHQGPFLTASLDVGRADEAGQRELRTRWEDHRRALAGQGVGEELLDAVEGAVLAPTGRGGQVGRLVVAAGAGGRAEVLVDVELAGAPDREEVVLGPAAHLLPAVRALNAAPSYLMVSIDRAGADIEVHSALSDTVTTSEVEGGHDELHKVPGGAWSQLKYQHRAEDSWERNATEVAQHVGELERRHRPAVVLVAGDDHAVSNFLSHAPKRVAEIATRVSGGRADGVNEQARDESVWQALDEHRQRAETELAGRFAQAEGRGDGAVQGLADVVDALRRGQVEEILLHDDPSSTLNLWVGDGPLDIAAGAGDLAALGSGSATEVRADTALVWAALGSDAGVTVLVDDDPRLQDGIGATLRWSDSSTPKEAVPSMPGHGEAAGGEPVT